MKRFIECIVCALASMIVLGSCTTENSKIGLYNPKSFTLDSLFTYLYQEELFNGVVAVVDSGELIFKKGFGIANLEDSSVFTETTAMELASVSKQFTAAAIMHLQEEEKLSVEDDIRDYLPGAFPYRGITIKNLLSHTGGLPNYTGYFIDHWPNDKMVFNQDILAYFMEVQPEIEFEPGTNYSYSNTGYVLLANIVKESSGMALDQYLQKYLFEPFNLRSARFYNRSEIYGLTNYAPSFMWSQDSCRYIRPEHLPGKAYYDFLSERLGPGRLSMNINDLLKWDSLLYTEEFINAKSKDAMCTPVSYAGVDTDYGFGFHNYMDEKVGAVSYHTGSWAGNLSYIKRFTDLKGTIIILNNTHSPYMKEIRKAVDNILTNRPLEPIMPSLKDRYTKLACRSDFDPVAWLKSLDLLAFSYEPEDLEWIKDIENH